MNASLKTMTACAASGILSLILAAPSFGQARNVALSHRDVAYEDDHKSQCVDVYLAESGKPTPAMISIHVGGCRAGSKDNIPIWFPGNYGQSRSNHCTVRGENPAAERMA